MVSTFELRCGEARVSLRVFLYEKILRGKKEMSKAHPPELMKFMDIEVITEAEWKVHGHRSDH